MRKRSRPHTLLQNLTDRIAALEGELACLPAGAERDEVASSIKQLEAAIRIDGWLRSSLRKPE